MKTDGVQQSDYKKDEFLGLPLTKFFLHLP
jgi:hypothetical protein